MTEVRSSEILVNNHARNWSRILDLGAAGGSGQARRCARAMVNNFTTVPVLQGLRKEHKPDIEGDPIKGPNSDLYVQQTLLPMLY